MNVKGNRKLKDNEVIIMDSPIVWVYELKKVRQCEKSRDNVYNQLEDLTYIAERFGFFDASDYIKKIL